MILELALGKLKENHDQVDILANEFNLSGGLCTNSGETSGCTMAREGVVANLPEGVEVQWYGGPQERQMVFSCDVGAGGQG